MINVQTDNTGDPRNQVFDSIFNHMTAQVLAQYQTVGITPSNVIISKAYRDSNPCNYAANKQSSGPHENDPNNYVTVVHN